MKMNLALNSWGRNLALVATLITVGTAATVCKGAAFDSPAGTWDFISSGGGQQGLAYMTFLDDNTFSGFVLVAGKSKSKSNSTGRDGSFSTERGGSSGSSSGGNDTLFGFTSIDGPWHFDTQGRVVGFFTEVVNVQSVVTNFGPTNVLESIPAPGNGDPATNVLVFFPDNAPTASILVTWEAPVAFSETHTFDNPSFVIEVGSAELTNAISFTGKVTPGKRMNLVSSTSFGKVNYKGLPAIPLLDFTGVNWNATKKSGDLLSFEFFTFGLPEDPAYPNIYPFAGIGPAYNVDGIAVFSRHKKSGFFSLAGETKRTTFGSLKVSQNGVTTANTKGFEQPGDVIRYTVSVQPAP